MKVFMSLLTALLCVCTAAPAMAVDNVIENPSFENGFTGWEVMTENNSNYAKIWDQQYTGSEYFLPTDGGYYLELHGREAKYSNGVIRPSYMATTFTTDDDYTLLLDATYRTVQDKSVSTPSEITVNGRAVVRFSGSTEWDWQTYGIHIGPGTHRLVIKADGDHYSIQGDAVMYLFVDNIRLVPGHVY